ncbi:MAG: hypothetical protein FD123_503 [Bacteroidetes bacterium]|nr:MAG: hypothetical protein FD123_503 [Bacteroidota bacterium]
MKKKIPVIIVFAFFTWLGWACGIGDAFVTEEIESIENPRDRAWAWRVEWFYQEKGRHPTKAEADSMRREFDASWPDSSKTGEVKPGKKKSQKKKNPDTANSKPDTAFTPPVPPPDIVPPPEVVPQPADTNLEE